MDKRAEAKRYMKHYFSLIAKAARVRWEGDGGACDAEIELLIDYIIDAAKEEMRDEEKRALNIMEGL